MRTQENAGVVATATTVAALAVAGCHYHRDNILYGPDGLVPVAALDDSMDLRPDTVSSTVAKIESGVATVVEVILSGNRGARNTVLLTDPTARQIIPPLAEGEDFEVTILENREGPRKIEEIGTVHLGQTARWQEALDPRNIDPDFEGSEFAPVLTQFDTRTDQFEPQVAVIQSGSGPVVDIRLKQTVLQENTRGEYDVNVFTEGTNGEITVTKETKTTLDGHVVVPLDPQSPEGTYKVEVRGEKSGTIIIFVSKDSSGKLVVNRINSTRGRAYINGEETAPVPQTVPERIDVTTGITYFQTETAPGSGLYNIRLSFTGAHTEVVHLTVGGATVADVPPQAFGELGPTQYPQLSRVPAGTLISVTPSVPAGFTYEVGAVQ